jgi:hypothetical protein
MKTVVLLIMAACGADPIFAGSPTVTLCLVNEAHLDVHVLYRAGKEAVAILGRAGVDLVC